MKRLKALADKVNLKRNTIVHQGEFCNEGEAKEHIECARKFITTLVGLYDQQFLLKERKR